MSERFTSYLSEKERAKLRAVADELDCSENFVLRTALRSALFGQPLPTWLTHATQVTDKRTEVHA